MEDSRGEYKSLVRKEKQELPKEKGYSSSVKTFERTDKIKKQVGTYGSKILSSKMSYKSGNPLKGLLKSKQKRATIVLRSNNGEHINLMRASW